MNLPLSLLLIFFSFESVDSFWRRYGQSAGLRLEQFEKNLDRLISNLHEQSSVTAIGFILLAGTSLTVQEITPEVRVQRISFNFISYSS